MAAAAVVQNATFSLSTASTSGTATFGSTPTSGNLLVAVSCDQTYTVSAVASGGNSWSFYGRGSYAGIDLAVFYRVAGASEATTVTFTSSSSTRFSGIIFELSGVATSAAGTSSGIINSTGTNNANDFYSAAAATSVSYNAPLATTYGYSDVCAMNVVAWVNNPGTIIYNIGTLVRPSQGTSNTAYVAAAYNNSFASFYNLGSLQTSWLWTTARSVVAAPLYFVSQTQSGQATNAATGNASGIVNGAGLPTGVTVSTAADVMNAAETETETDTAGIAATLADINTATSASDSVSGTSPTIIAANTNNLLTGAENTLGNTLQLAAAQSSSGVTAKVQAAAVPLALALALGGYGRTAAKGVPGKVAGNWRAATVRGATTTATVSSAWSTPTVHSAWEVVA